MTPNWFVAWPVSGPPDFLQPLCSTAPGGIEFLSPADIHVTLAFLGRFTPELERKMISLLKGLPLKSIAIATGDLIALPQPRRFSAIACSIRAGEKEVSAEINKWHARVCREAGAAIDTRPKLPHLTIARPVRRIGSEDRAAALEWIAGSNASGFSVPLRLERPRLFTWSERKEKNRYRLVDDGSIS